MISHLSRRQSPKAFFEPRPSEIFIRSGTPREEGGRRRKKTFQFPRKKPHYRSRPIDDSAIRVVATLSKEHLSRDGLSKAYLAKTETIIQESCRAYRPAQKRPGKLWPPLFGDVITRRFANHPSSLPFSPPLIRIKMSRCLTAFAMIFLFGLNAIACPLRERRRVYQKPFLRFFPQTSERSGNSTTALFHFFTPDCCPGTSYPRSYAYTSLN